MDIFSFPRGFCTIASDGGLLPNALSDTGIPVPVPMTATSPKMSGHSSLTRRVTCWNSPWDRFPQPQGWLQIFRWRRWFVQGTQQQTNPHAIDFSLRQELRWRLSHLVGYEWQAPIPTSYRDGMSTWWKNSWPVARRAISATGSLPIRTDRWGPILMTRTTTKLVDGLPPLPNTMIVANEPVTKIKSLPRGEYLGTFPTTIGPSTTPTPGPPSTNTVSHLLWSLHTPAPQQENNNNNGDDELELLVPMTLPFVTRRRTKNIASGSGKRPVKDAI